MIRSVIRSRFCRHRITRSSSGLTLFQYARNVTKAFLVAFLVFSESLRSIKVCISSYDNVEKRFLLSSLGSIIDHLWLQLETVSGGSSRQSNRREHALKIMPFLS